MRRLFFLTIFALCLTSRLADATRLIVVLPIDSTMTEGHMTAAAKASLEEMLRDVATNALTHSGWVVLTGENTLQLIKDNGTDPEKCGDQSCHLSLARELHVEKFLSGAVQWAEGEYTASFRLIDTKSGQIMASERLEGATVKELRATFEDRALSFFQRGEMLPAPIAASTPLAAPVRPMAPSVDSPPAPEIPAGLAALKVSGLPPGAGATLRGPNRWTASGVLPWVQEDIPSGMYTLEVNKNGFSPSVRDLFLEAGKTTEVQIVLDRAYSEKERFAKKHEGGWSRWHFGLGFSLLGWEWGYGSFSFRLGFDEISGRIYLSSPGNDSWFIGLGPAQFIGTTMLLSAQADKSRPFQLSTGIAGGILAAVGIGYQWRIGTGYLSLGGTNIIEWSQ